MSYHAPDAAPMGEVNLTPLFAGMISNGMGKSLPPPVLVGAGTLGFVGYLLFKPSPVVGGLLGALVGSVVGPTLFPLLTEATPVVPATPVNGITYL